MLEVRDLHKYYGAFHAVRGISFDVDRGEIVGFLGPNGAGKTTTMKIAVGFMTMSSGSIRVDDHDVVNDSMEIRRRIGYLPENAPLYEDMTVSEYLSFIADVRGLRGQLRKERFEYVIGVCALEPKRKSGIKTLSKGYRQRVGLAQAIIHDPKLVILDEPTVGLDPNQIIEIRNLIQEIGTRNTVVLSSHILAEVEATCSRVVIINEGSIVANGTAEQLESELAGTPLLEISIGAELEDAQASIQAIDGIERIVEARTNGEASLLTVEVGEADNLIYAVSNMAKQKGWVLDGIVRPKRTLEDVFKSLTSGKLESEPEEEVALSGAESDSDEGEKA